MPDPINNQNPIVDATGKFSDNWKESLPEDIRGEESLKMVTDFPGAIKQLVNAQKMVGKDKVVVPGPNSTDAEKDAFYTAIGRPEKVGDYKFDVHEDLKEIFTEERMANAKNIAHKIGVTQSQFEQYMKVEVDSAVALLAEQDKQDEIDMQNAQKDLKTRFGGAYDERMHIANRLVSEIIPEGEKRVKLLEKFGNDPDFIEFVSDTGSKLVEHKALIAELTTKTPKEAESRMNQLRATPGYITSDPATGKYLIDSDPAKHKQITEEIKRLIKETYPEARKQGERVGI